MSPPNLLNITLDDVADGFDTGQYTSQDLVKAYTERIAEVNHQFKAVLQVNPDALSIAYSLDQERKVQGTVRSPLHGVPILVKDNIWTNDKTDSSAGSYVLLGARCKHESTVSRKLREAGAIILGKTNQTEWSNWRTLDPNNNGWSARGGQCTGPYYKGQDPYGSSSGSGVAGALALAYACIGTETDGSITTPSKAGALAGIKPTVGLVSRYGIIPISATQDTAGPMARTMKDAAVILSAIAGKCDLDSFTAKIPFNTIPDYGAACKPSLAGLRIGVPRKMVEADKLEDAFQSAFEDSFKVLEKLGATILDNVEIKSQEEWSKWSDAEKMYVLEGDFRDLIPKFLAELDQNPNNIRSIPDMMEATKNEPREEFEKRGYNRWEQCLKAPEGEALEARRRDMLRICKEDGILGALEEHSLDMLVIPGAKAELSSWAARAGLPITITPLGFFPGSQEVKMDESKTLVDVGPGVPFALSFIGREWSEEKLIHAAYAFEQAANVREKGKLITTPRTELKDVVATNA